MKKFVIAAIAVVSAIVLIYLAGVAFFSDRFPLRCSLNGTDVSGLKVSEAAKALDTSASVYKLNVSGREGLSFVLTGPEIGLSVASESLAKSASDLYPAWKWPADCVTKTNAELPEEVAFSEESLSDIVKNSCFFKDPKIKPPADAYLELKDGKCHIMPEDKGSKADPDKAVTAVSEAVSALAPEVDLDKENAYVEPAVTSLDPGLIKKEDDVNKALNLTITMDMGGDRQEVIGPELTTSWISLDGDNFSIDQDLVTEYVKELGKKYNTVGKKREFTTHEGNVMNLSQGPYGWRINRGETSQLISDTIMGLSDCTIEPVWTDRAAAYGDDDIGNTYVEIDLDQQHVWAYQNGEEMVSTDCVSGKAINGSSTPNGIFPLTYKERNATLRGENYESHVDYWMPFNGNVGMHDASWRSEFGGKIYVTSGSHGCVNLPRSAAQAIFEIVEKNTPVIVYGGMSSEAARQFKQQMEMEQAMLQFLLEQQEDSEGQE